MRPGVSSNCFLGFCELILFRRRKSLHTRMMLRNFAILKKLSVAIVTMCVFIYFWVCFVARCGHCKRLAPEVGKQMMMIIINCLSVFFKLFASSFFFAFVFL